eukprot:s863_g40.t1
MPLSSDSSPMSSNCRPASGSIGGLVAFLGPGEKEVDGNCIVGCKACLFSISCEAVTRANVSVGHQRH